MGKKEASPALAEASKLVERLLADPAAEPFGTPVLWKEWGLLDYPEIVKEPMDLGTIKTKLDTNKYKDFDAFTNDLKLVWSNCMAYNADGSDLYKLAKKLDKQCDRDLNKLRKKFDLGGTEKKTVGRPSLGAQTTRNPSADEKASFCRSIYELNEISLGKLITFLDETCDAALIRNSTDDIEINVDAIDLQSFRKAEAFVKKMLAEEKASAGKKKKIVAGGKLGESNGDQNSRRSIDEDVEMEDAS